VYIFRGYGSISYKGHRVNVKAREANKHEKSSFPQCKTSIGNTSGPIDDDRAVKFVCRMGFSGMADRMVWPPSLSRDQE